jgi:uncharacterized membrane protein YeaQ/YmgE (transglycosylase-associated protein family)
VNPAIGYLGWIIIGALAGWIGSKLMGTDARQGGLANIVVGIIGAFVGGFVTQRFFGDNQSSAESSRKCHEETMRRMRELHVLGIPDWK